MQTLVELFDHESNMIEFLMSWNRRIQESTQFFQLMKEAGFSSITHGKGLYSFYRPDRMDNYLLHCQSIAPCISQNTSKSRK